MRKSKAYYLIPYKEELPDTLIPTRPPSLVQLWKPHFKVKYESSEGFKNLIGTLDNDDSVHGNLKLDTVVAAQILMDHIQKTGDTCADGIDLKTGIKVLNQCKRGFGVSFTQRIRKAQERRLLAQSTPEVPDDEPLTSGQ